MTITNSKDQLRELLPFMEVTAEAFEFAFESVPPKRYFKAPNQPTFFFNGECYTADLYFCFVHWNGKFYSAVRSLHLTNDEVINEFFRSLPPQAPVPSEEDSN